MRISNSTTQLLAASNLQQKAATKKTTSSKKLRLSSGAALRKKAQLMLDDISEARMDKIEGIRQALEQGNYEIDGQRVAHQIVSNALGERSW